MITTVLVKCPYCGLEQRVNISFENYKSSHAELLFCDIDEGGCDKRFVVISDLEIKTKGAKIEE